MTLDLLRDLVAIPSVPGDEEVGDCAHLIPGDDWVEVAPVHRGAYERTVRAFLR